MKISHTWCTPPHLKMCASHAYTHGSHSHTHHFCIKSHNFQLFHVTILVQKIIYVYTLYVSWARVIDLSQKKFKQNFVVIVDSRLPRN